MLVDDFFNHPGTIKVAYTVSGGSNLSLIQFVNIIHPHVSLHDKLTLSYIIVVLLGNLAPVSKNMIRQTIFCF